MSAAEKEMVDVCGMVAEVVLVEQPPRQAEARIEYPAAAGTAVGRAAKRSVDVAVAVTGLVVLGPVLAVLALVVRVSSQGPALFGHRRVGRGGRTFRCWKFRSMYIDAEDRLKRDPQMWARYVANDFKLDCDEDPRVSPLGRFLRKTSLDELPQLVNVLVGQMSLVGPRPVVVPELESYGAHAAAYLAVRPGITGPWQVSGRNDIRYPERAELDADYVAGWSLWGDISILVRTVPAVLRRVGID